VGFFEAIAAGFSSYVTFSGRAVRSEYWYWVLFVSSVGVAIYLIDLAIFRSHHGPVETIWHLTTIVPGLAVAVRRLHDMNRSGWWLLVVLAVVVLLVLIFVGNRDVLLLMTVLVIGWVGLIWWFCQPGTPGPNSYGPDPFGPDGHITLHPTA
jgi:uncharacterized membrane protein YhaH (DUF805 family)